MEYTTEKKLEKIKDLAYCDEEYLQMLEQMRIMEDRVDELEHRLSDADRDLIWDFWGLSTAIDERKLVLACRHMEFND